MLILVCGSSLGREVAVGGDVFTTLYLSSVLTLNAVADYDSGRDTPSCFVSPGRSAGVGSLRMLFNGGRNTRR